MRYLNGKNYANRLLPIFNGVERVMIPIAPTSV
jgi:hypothetical protein